MRFVCCWYAVAFRTEELYSQLPVQNTILPLGAKTDFSPKYFSKKVLELLTGAVGAAEGVCVLYAAVYASYAVVFRSVFWSCVTLLSNKTV